MLCFFLLNFPCSNHLCLLSRIVDCDCLVLLMLSSYLNQSILCLLLGRCNARHIHSEVLGIQLGIFKLLLGLLKYRLELLQLFTRLQFGNLATLLFDYSFLVIYSALQTPLLRFQTIDNVILVLADFGHEIRPIFFHSFINSLVILRLPLEGL